MLVQQLASTDQGKGDLADFAICDSFGNICIRRV